MSDTESGSESMSISDHDSQNLSIAVLILFFITLFAGFVMFTWSLMTRMQKLYYSLYLIFGITSVWYFMDIAINPKGSRSCIQSELNWIVFVTSFLSFFILSNFLFMKGADVNTSIFKILWSSSIAMIIIIIVVNFVMIFPVVGSSALNPYTQCWMPFTIPVIILSMIGLLILIFLYFQNK